MTTGEKLGKSNPFRLENINRFVKIKFFQANLHCIFHLSLNIDASLNMSY